MAGIKVMDSRRAFRYAIRCGRVLQKSYRIPKGMLSLRQHSTSHFAIPTALLYGWLPLSSPNRGFVSPPSVWGGKLQFFLGDNFGQQSWRMNKMSKFTTQDTSATCIPHGKKLFLLSKLSSLNPKQIMRLNLPKVELFIILCRKNLVCYVFFCNFAPFLCTHARKTVMMTARTRVADTPP